MRSVITQESRGLTILLVAPNVSEQMGGEAIKALQIFQELRKLHPNTIQITHARNERELNDRLKLNNVYYVRDNWVALFLWNSVILRWFLNFWFCRRAVKLAEQIVDEQNLPADRVILHQTEPNSPVLPRIVSRKLVNVFGPINGDIHYPKAFRRHENLKDKLRRILHAPVQRINRVLFRGIAKADLVLLAGGERTRNSLLRAGCRPERMVSCIDCGVKDAILDRPRVQHLGENYRFIHFGRLVFQKGTFLIIESLRKTKHKVCLDIVGKGPELDHCQRLVRELGLENRVRFLGWYTNHAELLDSFKYYRGVVFPSFQDANGIVVQEAMAVGLPTICLDWGGPQLLIDNEKTGFLIEPLSKDYITDKMASCLDQLGQDGVLAENMSKLAREEAESWRWSNVMKEWMVLYAELRNGRNAHWTK